MIVFSKILIIVSVLGLLRCSETFRTASQQLDQQAFSVLQRMMHATEELGYPRQFAPLLIVLTALCFMLSMYVLELSFR